MIDFNNLIQSKNGNFDEEKKESMKDYIDFTLDTTKKGQPKIENKTLPNNEESKINIFNKLQSQTNIKTIDPNSNYSYKESYHKNPPTKESKNHKKTIQLKFDENTGQKYSFVFQDFNKLRPHFFKIGDYLEPFNIKIVGSDPINIKQAIQKIDIGINKYEEIFKNEKSLSEIAKIFAKYNYSKEIKQELKGVIDCKSQNIYFDNIENSMNTNFEENNKDNINNNIVSNCLGNEMISSITSNKEATKKKDSNFLNKKRNLEEDKTELAKQEKKIFITKEKISNDTNTIKNAGRLPNESKNKGIKGIKDGSHPDNGVIKIMRHSLNNICCIFITILQIIDTNAYIFLPGINDKDLKNTTTKQDYLEKTIEDILCNYISIETKKDKIEENRNKINGLLGADIPGKEKEQNLLKKILKMKLKDVCLNFINNINNFIDGYTFNTFVDDEDFKKYDDSKIKKILKQADDLMNSKIRKRNKKPQLK